MLKILTILVDYFLFNVLVILSNQYLKKHKMLVKMEKRIRMHIISFIFILSIETVLKQDPAE